MKNLILKNDFYKCSMINTTKNKIITRFAPSPTGELHLGGARTALFNYLFSVQSKGKFFLRIEDTDKKRSNKIFEQNIIDTLIWLGINWDDKIFYQSKRIHRYQEVAFNMLKNDLAYYCFTTQDEINNQRNLAISKKKPFIFKSSWRLADKKTYPKDRKPVIRLKVKQDCKIILQDTLQGIIKVNSTEVDDMVLLRQDLSPTYMLASVVDDHDMNITHIIRGDDHLTNAIRQVVIYNSLNWQIPVMTHIPLVADENGSKLSKRSGAKSVLEYKKLGYLAESVCNHLIKLGWSHKNQEIISFKEQKKFFNLQSLNKSKASINHDKMQYLNLHYINKLNPQQLFDQIISIIKEKYSISVKESIRIKNAIKYIQNRGKLLNNIAEEALIYLDIYPFSYEKEARENIIELNDKIFHLLKKTLSNIEEKDFLKDSLLISLKDVAKNNNLSLKDLLIPLRSMMLGKTKSMSIVSVLEIIGKGLTINRINRASQLFRIF